MKSNKAFSRAFCITGIAALFCFQAFAQRPLGIDVSDYQGTINWTSVKASGISFAWAKSTEGLSATESTFTGNMANAKAAGVFIGAYHYAHPETHTGTAGALSEAAEFWSIAGKYITNGGYYMMPMLDVESDLTGAGYTKATLSSWVNTWCSNIVSRAASNGVTVKPFVYTYVSYSSTWLDSTVTYWPLWMAQYPSSPNPQTGTPSGTSPWASSAWQFWQYSSTGTVPSIIGNVDLDVFNGTSSSIATFVIGGLGPPYFLSQPSSRNGDRGGSIKMTTTAGGAATLKYQWRFNGTNITSATTTALTLSNLQATNGGSYTVVVTNSSGIVTSSVALLTINGLYAAVFTDQFDTNSSGLWTTNKSSTDTKITFNYDYSANGIPSAPNSTGGTTRGVKFEANVTLGVTAACNMSPTGKTFSGDYRLHFDMWINANGPFPAGGTGSTEHFTAGVGTAGNKVQWNSGTADGFWFANDGEGQATDTSATLPDIRAYSGITLQATNSGVYVGGPEPDVRGNNHPYYQNVFPGGQTAPSSQGQTGGLEVGSVGFAWRDVVVSKTGNKIEWFIDGLKFCVITNATLTSSNVFVGYWDSFTSISDNSALSFGLVDNVRVENLITIPFVLTQPQNQSVTQGSNATFTISAVGDPSPGYQWRYNGADISSATASTYTKSSAQPADAGSFTVVLTNTLGSTTSSVATLTVNIPPTISVNPQDQTINQNSNLVFTVTASGSPSPAYQWQHAGTNLASATTSSYAINNVQSTHAGSYRVIVTNIAGSLTSSIATLTVNLHPAISSQPQPLSITQGSNATFSVTAGGTAPLSYQWRFNNADISTATTSSYAVNNAQPGDAGSYTVVITNVASGITSSVATLTINIPPTISVNPQDQTINQNSNTTFTVTASGSPSPAYQWQHAGTNLPGATTSSYAINNAQAAHAGSYRVIVTNIAGSLTSSVATLIVNIHPTISSQPQNQSVTQGSNATFSVTAGGTAPLSYQWRFNNADIASATDSSYTKSSAQPGDAGSYTVVITNVASGITSSVATLTVNIPPSIDTQPLSQTVNQTSNMLFTVTASGSPSPAYQWQRNGANLSGATASSYSITNVQSANAGSYRVVVTNVAGSLTSVVAILSVNIPPSISAHPQDKAVKTGGHATFTVSASGTEILSYQWRFNSADISSATDSSYTKSNAQTNDAGSYSVIVSNIAGSVTSSNALLTVTPPMPPHFEFISQLPGQGAHLFVSGEIGSVYDIQTSSNMLDWSAIGSFTNADDVFEFIDASASSVTQRFYRARFVQ